MSKIFCYIRVSTDQQAESGLGAEAQIGACEKWAQTKKRLGDRSRMYVHPKTSLNTQW